MTRAKSYDKSLQRGRFVAGHQSEPDVTLHPVTIVRDTEKAMLVQVKDAGEPIWLPHSQIRKTTRPATGPCTVVISHWIAKQKGLA